MGQLETDNHQKRQKLTQLLNLPRRIASSAETRDASGPYLQTLVLHQSSPRLSASVAPPIARRPPLPAQVSYNSSCGPSAPNLSLRTQSFTTRRRSCLALCLDRVASRLQLAVDLRTFGILGDQMELLHRPAPPSTRYCSHPASAAKIPARSSRDQLVCAFVRVSRSCAPN